MGLLLSPYRPGEQRDVCFIDAACIHQTDVELMHRGIRSIGGFLLVARELRILWSSTYLTRLWCVAQCRFGAKVGEVFSSMVIPVRGKRRR